ncbi:MAG: impB/mucB/samB family protein [Pseudomonadota bacterium]
MIEQNMNKDLGQSVLSPEKEGLKWLFLDLNSYFASVEQNENRDLMGRPVAVVPMMTDATCAIAASYEAKAYGIKTGTKIYEAKKICPDLVCIQADHKKYVEYHHRIIAATEKVLPVHKTWSVDEFDCLLLGRERQSDNAITLANKIKKQIHHDIGPAINCSIGIAPNSFLAKVATEIEKPDGLVLLKPEELPGRLLDLKLTDLPGINIAMLKRLKTCHIHTVEQLYQTSPKQARAIWRSVQGERFWYWLHGYDVPYQSTSPSMLGHSRMLDPSLRTVEKTRQMARRLLFKACYRLRRKNLYATNLVLKLRFIDGNKWGGFRDFPASQDPFTMMTHLKDLWQQMEFECFGNAPLPSNRKMIFLKVSTLLHGLREGHCITDDLFQQYIAKDNQDIEKQNRLAAALDHLQDKYKKETVWLGVVPETLAGNVGTKIAFNRVPEKDEFWH